MAKIINFFGSPGASKSTNSAMLFALMKRHGIKCELVTEYAKDVVYRGDLDTLSDCQPLVFGKQHHRIIRASKKVDYVITDSPIALSAVYAKNLPESFKKSCIDIFNTFDNTNYFLKLDPVRYKTYGRTQTLEESLEIEKQVLDTLYTNGIKFTLVKDAEQVFKILSDNELRFYGKTCDYVDTDGTTCNKPQAMDSFGIGCCTEHAIKRLEYFGSYRY